jgi:hexosaminidase
MFLTSKRFLSCLTLSLIVSLWIGKTGKAATANLADMGYSVIPTPREVRLTGNEIDFNNDWVIEARNFSMDDASLKSLVRDLNEWYGLKIKVGAKSRRIIRLTVKEDVIRSGEKPEIDDQGYLLEISPSRIIITGNSNQGLFYGVQTLIQMIKPVSGGKYMLPEGTIKDWPSAQLRFLHWDTKHHQDRMETLKRYLDWSARFKVNMIGFELEDKFEYPTHPVIGAPGAFTTEELQEIVDYGLERYIQVVPQIQSPAHMAYVLKHPEFKDMRATCENCPLEGLNYQVCLCEEKAYDLIFDMYEDVINATKGVDYFHVSTDEAYFTGICDKCDRPYNEENRSLAWVEFVQRAHNFLQDHNRRMLAWLEYPLLTKHISMLPSDIIDGVQRGEDFIKAEQENGMDGLIYVSLQGGERLIPNNFPVEQTGVEQSSDKNYTAGRLETSYNTLSFPGEDATGRMTVSWDSKIPPLGVYGAAWDDSGLHNETFWMGWSTLAQYGWTPGIPSVNQHVTDFVKIYYGSKVNDEDIKDIYTGLRNQADFFGRSWIYRTEVPEVRVGYGTSSRIYEKPRISRTRSTLPQPAIPNPDNLEIEPVYQGKYGELVSKASELYKSNQLIQGKIQKIMKLADRNHYNLEVLHSIAELTRHHDEMILSMKKIENEMQSAARQSKPQEAMKHLVAAYQTGSEVIRDRENTYQYFKSVWEKSRYPKGISVGGKNFYHVQDDIKGHWADSEPDLSFYITSERRMDIEGWKREMEQVIRKYADKNNISLNSLLETGSMKNDAGQDFQRGLLHRLSSNSWTKVLQTDNGARRFSAFRYVPDIDRFLLWGFQGYYTWDAGNAEIPWTGNEEYDMVAFNPVEVQWENHFPLSKKEEWSENLPPMHLISYYQGITPGYYRPELKVREGILRPDLTIVGDQLTYDSKRQRMIYFTGGRTLSYDVIDRIWHSIDTEKTPPPVSFGSLCYDPIDDRIILFGGGHVAEPGPDGKAVGYTGTWEFDCTSEEWSPLETEENPPPRMCSRMVYDSKNKAMVVFGGDGQSRWLGDTWILDLQKNTWRKSNAPGPSARAGHFTVFDPSTGWVIIGGGYNYDDLTDMWGYNVTSDSWRKLRGEVPTGWHITADIIQDESLIILTTSTKRDGDTRSCNEIYPVRTTWAYKIDAQTLEDETIAPQSTQYLLKRPVEMAVAGTEQNPSRHKEQLDRIENMEENRWTAFRHPGRVAPVRTWGSCAFDTDKGRIIYWGGGHCGYGGNDYDLYDVEQNTWITSPEIAEYPERAWDKGINPGGVTFSGKPWIRHGRKIYAYDPVSKKIINTKTVYVTAGYEPDPLKEIEPKGIEDNLKSPYQIKWTTWTYDEETEKWNINCSSVPGLDHLVQTPHGVMGVDLHWELLDILQRPDKANLHEFKDTVMWEGQPMVDNSVYSLDVAAQKWKKLTVKGPWPQNLFELTALVYDSRRDQLILHGGGEKRDELWRFPLKKKQWEKIEPSFAPGAGTQPPVCTREAVYLPDNDVFLTTGTPSGVESMTGFWAYKVDENRWYKVDIEIPEGKTMKDLLVQNRGWAYDPIHDIVFMILGNRAGDMSEVDLFGLRYKHPGKK